jgi:hypothetical protein
MTEPDHLPITPAASNQEAPTLAPQPPDTQYGYTLPGRRSALVVVTSMVLLFLVAIAVFLPLARPWIVPLCASVIPMFALALAAAVPLAAAGKSDAPAAPLLAGWAAILGGAACDIFATVFHSPDLAREGNPTLRGLLDNGVPLEQVFLYGAASQALFIALALVLWLGLLKHRHTLAATMPPSGSLLTYLKARTGGRELSYRQWICPLAYAELPWANHVAWSLGFIFVGASVYRFYLALEWYGVAPLDPLWVRFVAPSVVLVAMCWWYAVWLRGAQRRQSSDIGRHFCRGQEQADRQERFTAANATTASPFIQTLDELENRTDNADNG